MDSPFTVEEIRKAVFECDRDKALGLDGFSMALFQERWKEIKVDLEQVFKEFFERGILDNSLNETYVCLIPKEGTKKG